jgi:hypothetical protein
MPFATSHFVSFFPIANPFDFENLLVLYDFPVVVFWEEPPLPTFCLLLAISSPLIPFFRWEMFMLASESDTKSSFRDILLILLHFSESASIGNVSCWSGFHALSVSELVSRLLVCFLNPTLMLRTMLGTSFLESSTLAFAVEQCTTVDRVLRLLLAVL